MVRFESLIDRYNLFPAVYKIEATAIDSKNRWFIIVELLKWLKSNKVLS